MRKLWNPRLIIKIIFEAIFIVINNFLYLKVQLKEDIKLNLVKIDVKCISLIIIIIITIVIIFSFNIIVSIFIIIIVSMFKMLMMVVLNFSGI